MTRWLLYGANGYTGEITARLAAARGRRPVLAGRSPAVRALADELGLEQRRFPLADAAAHLDDIEAVVHCAGPFAVTAMPMLDACLATGTHYIDITGEIDVFEEVFARHAEAVAAGIVALPGAGFDVVPSDCLAALLHRRLPAAVRLDLAFIAGGGPSRGTARTSVAGARRGRRRIGGRLVDTPIGTPRRVVAFPRGRRTVAAIPWGDLVTAYRSTGIGDITTYTALPTGARATARAIGLSPVRTVADLLVRAAVSGPSPAVRARTGAQVWGEVRDADGRIETAALLTPNGYDLTADSVVRAVERIREVPPGAHTPSTAFGGEYALDLDGVSLA